MDDNYTNHNRGDGNVIMDTSTLLSITGKLPSDKIIESKLPPLLGPLPMSEESNKLSYNYHNVLELINCNFTNSATSNETGTFYIGHSYNPADKYKNQYIEVKTPQYTSKPNPSGTDETVPWTSMTYYQIMRILNNGWELLFGNKLIEHNSNSRTCTMTIPSGFGVFFCHSVIWKMLGMEEVTKDLLITYTPTTPAEAKKFKGVSGKITGVRNKSSNTDLILKGVPVTYARLEDLYNRVATKINNDSNVSRATYFFAIISFAHSRHYYSKYATYSYPLELIPFSTLFIENFKKSIVDYSKNRIIELLNTDGNNTPTIHEVCTSSLEISVENNKYMFINIGKMYAEKGITIFVIFNTVLRKFLGGIRSIEVHDSTIINTIDHNEVIKSNVFKYPFYLLLISTDDRNDFQESIIDSTRRNIIGIIHSETHFTSTQNIIKMRPSTYNKLVLKLVNNEFKPIAESVVFNLLFKFKRDFMENSFELDFKQWV